MTNYTFQYFNNKSNDYKIMDHLILLQDLTQLVKLNAHGLR